MTAIQADSQSSKGNGEAAVHIVQILLSMYKLDEDGNTIVAKELYLPTQYEYVES